MDSPRPGGASVRDSRLGRLGPPEAARRAPLPIDDGLPAVLGVLERRGAAVVLAPPGAGKTTRVPQALLDAGLLGDGSCLILEPRRVAARAAARRVAAERGTDLGGEVGYQVRFDRRTSTRTRLLFVTEGILTARLQDDPLLEGVGAVILDEFHERSLEADLVLAFLREVRQGPRPDLRVLVLSATLDPGPVASYLGAQVVEVSGRSYPVEVAYLPQPASSPASQLAAKGVRTAWDRRPDGRGDLLAFLPGAGEIRRAVDLLKPWAEGRGVKLVTLHGDLPAAAQDEALRPSTTPRVILSTNVAESSVTLEGVSAVVDTGLAKVLRYDPALGLDRLETVPVSLASADQRAGRAGRIGPGFALRLWTAHEDRGRRNRIEPEVARVDLTNAVLQVLAWGHPDPFTFHWMEPPDPIRVRSALDLLRRLGALRPGGGLTSAGRALARLPLHPRLGALLLAACRAGLAAQGARLAAILAERDILVSGRTFGPAQAAPTGPSDVLHRLDLLEEAAGARFDPARLDPLGVDPGAARAAWKAAHQLEHRAKGTTDKAGAQESPGGEEGLLRLLLAAYPDRVARRRAPGSDRFVLVGGRGAVLARESAVRHAEFLVAVRLGGGSRGNRAEDLIRWASGIEPGWLDDLHTRSETGFDAGTGRVWAREHLLYGDLVVAEKPVRPDPREAGRLLAAEAAKDPVATLKPGKGAQSFVTRCRFLNRAVPDLGLPSWGEETWREVLSQLALGKTSLGELRGLDLLPALEARLTWRQRQTLNRDAPERLPVPSGSLLRVTYPEDGQPFLAVKIQEAFGWRQGPRIAGGRVPVVLHLLGPHGRPLQVTQDLESFWRTTYPEVRKEMRGRYPKHRWPEDPLSAEPSRKTTKR